VLRDVPWPGLTRPLDELVAAPSGLWIVEARPWHDIAVARGRVVTADADVTTDVQHLDQVRVQVARDLGLTPVESHALVVVPEEVPALRLEGVVIVGQRLVHQIIVSPGRRLTSTQLDVLARRTAKVLEQAKRPEPSAAPRASVVPPGAPAGPYQSWWDAPGPGTNDPGARRPAAPPPEHFLSKDSYDDGYDEPPPPLPTPEELGLPPALEEPSQRRRADASDPIWPIAPPPGMWPDPEPEPDLAQLVAHGSHDVDMDEVDPHRTRVVQSAWADIDDDESDMGRTRVVESNWADVDDDESDMGRTRVVDYPAKPLVTPGYGTPQAQSWPHEPITEEAVAAFERDWERLSREPVAHESFSQDSLADPQWDDDEPEVPSADPWLLEDPPGRRSSPAGSRPQHPDLPVEHPGRYIRPEPDDPTGKYPPVEPANDALPFEQYYEPAPPAVPAEEISFDQYYEPIAPVGLPEPELVDNLPFGRAEDVARRTDQTDEVPFAQYYDPLDVLAPAEPSTPVDEDPLPGQHRTGDAVVRGFRPGRDSLAHTDHDADDYDDYDGPLDDPASDALVHEPDDLSFDDNFPTIESTHGDSDDRRHALTHELPDPDEEPPAPARPERYVRPVEPRAAGRYVRDDDDELGPAQTEPVALPEPTGPARPHGLAAAPPSRVRTGPWDLTPAQATVVSTHFAGPVRVRGAFGTGRSVALAHRAVHLAMTRPGVVAVVVPSPAQIAPTRRRLASIADEDVLAQIVVDVPAGIAGSVLTEFGTDVNPAPEEVARAWAAAQRATGLGAAQGRSIGLLRDEVTLIRGHSSMSEGGYQRLRKELPSGLRHQVWVLHQAYVAELHHQNVPDEHDLVRMARAALRAGVPSRFTSAVVDDANDLTPAQLSMVCEIVGTGDDALTVADDGLPGLAPVSPVLADTGIDIGGRQIELTHQFRLTGPAWTSLVRLLQPDTGRDITGAVDRPRLAGRMDDGEGPAYLRSQAIRLRRDKLIERIFELVRDGVAPESIALLHIEEEPEPELVAELFRAGVAVRDLDALDRPGVALGRARDSRGVEYDHVLVPDARHRDVVPAGALRWDQRQRRRLLGLALSRSRDTAWIAGI